MSVILYNRMADPSTGFFNISTFYLAWIITIATVVGFLWQGFRWLYKKVKNDRIKAIEEEEARHEETRKFVEEKTKEAIDTLTNQTNIINTNISYQDQSIKELKESTDRMNEKVNSMHIILTEHKGIFDNHKLRIDKLEESNKELKNTHRDIMSRFDPNNDRRSVM